MAVVEVSSIRDVFEVLEREGGGLGSGIPAAWGLGWGWVPVGVLVGGGTHPHTSGAGRGAGETWSGVASHARNACRGGGG